MLCGKNICNLSPGGYITGEMQTSTELTGGKNMSLVKEMWSGGQALDIRNLPMHPDAEAQIIQRPDEKYSFLHDCMITKYHGKIYTAWYNCPKGEMQEDSVIRGRISADDGRSWSEVKTFAQDHDQNFMYVPPSFGICPQNGHLYLIATRMVGPDLVHDFEIFELDEATETFHSVRRIDHAFLPNTPVYRMNNGKLIMGGRMSELDNDFPVYTAVAISDSGKIDGNWRIVQICPYNKGFDGWNYLPETCLSIYEDGSIIAFVRHDRRYPQIYESFDFGESWTPSQVHDIPVGDSKLFSGVLSDGRSYLITNLANQKRDTLALFLSKPGERTFSEAFLLRNGVDETLNATPEWSYPAAVEDGGSLYVVCTSAKTSATFIKVRL